MNRVTESYIVEYVSSHKEAADEFFGGESYHGEFTEFWTEGERIFVYEISSGTYRVDVCNYD